MFKLFLKRLISCVTLAAFLCAGVTPVYAQGIVTVLDLPKPGRMVDVSASFVPPILKGISVDVKNPFKFNFILDTGNSLLKDEGLKDEAAKLIRYFMASLTIPEKDLWVNLSPYEKDRVINDELSTTEMGRDMLAQDYLLKQITASLIYPENETGKAFWQNVYTRAYALYGTTDIPVDTFNKVWILPDQAEVYENGTKVFITKATMKVMLDTDYQAIPNNPLPTKASEGTNPMPSELSKEVMREVIIPLLEKEVNEGRNFSQLRQVYYALILAKWYKDTLKDSIINRKYSDQKKVNGVDLEDKDVKQQIYAQYLQAFQKGVFNYIKEERSINSEELIPRKYFSGGVDYAMKIKIKKIFDFLSIFKTTGNPLMLEVLFKNKNMVSPALASPVVHAASVIDRKKAGLIFYNGQWREPSPEFVYHGTSTEKIREILHSGGFVTPQFPMPGAQMGQAIYVSSSPQMSYAREKVRETGGVPVVLEFRYDYLHDHGITVMPAPEMIRDPDNPQLPFKFLGWNKAEIIKAIPLSLLTPESKKALAAALMQDAEARPQEFTEKEIAQIARVLKMDAHDRAQVFFMTNYRDLDIADSFFNYGFRDVFFPFKELPENPFKTLIRERLKTNKNPVIADAGCGVGALLNHAHEMFGISRENLIGIDLKEPTEELRKAAKDEIKRMDILQHEKDQLYRHIDPIGPDGTHEILFDYQAGDITTTKLKKGVDALVSVFVLQYVPDPLRAIANLFNNLNEGGTMKVHLMIPDRDHDMVRGKMDPSDMYKKFVSDLKRDGLDINLHEKGVVLFVGDQVSPQKHLLFEATRQKKAMMTRVRPVEERNDVPVLLADGQKFSIKEVRYPVVSDGERYAELVDPVEASLLDALDQPGEVVWSRNIGTGAEEYSSPLRHGGIAQDGMGFIISSGKAFDLTTRNVKTCTVVGIRAVDRLGRNILGLAHVLQVQGIDANKSYELIKATVSALNKSGARDIRLFILYDPSTLSGGTYMPREADLHQELKVIDPDIQLRVLERRNFSSAEVQVTPNMTKLNETNIFSSVKDYPRFFAWDNAARADQDDRSQATDDLSTGKVIIEKVAGQIEGYMDGMNIGDPDMARGVSNSLSQFQKFIYSDKINVNFLDVALALLFRKYHHDAKGYQNPEERMKATKLLAAFFIYVQRYAGVKLGKEHIARDVYTAFREEANYRRIKPSELFRTIQSLSQHMLGVEIDRDIIIRKLKNEGVKTIDFAELPVVDLKDYERVVLYANERLKVFWEELPDMRSRSDFHLTVNPLSDDVFFMMDLVNKEGKVMGNFEAILSEKNRNLEIHSSFINYYYQRMGIGKAVYRALNEAWGREKGGVLYTEGAFEVIVGPKNSNEMGQTPVEQARMMWESLKDMGLAEKSDGGGYKMLAVPSHTKGGIDFNTGRLDVERTGSRSDLDWGMSPDELENVQINGLVPVIMKIVPVKDVSAFLGASH